MGDRERETPGMGSVGETVDRGHHDTEAVSYSVLEYRSVKVLLSRREFYDPYACSAYCIACSEASAATS